MKLERLRMEHWYVYYKVAANDTAIVADRVRAMMASLGTSGAHGRLLRRPGAVDGEVTLMEVYEPVADARTFGAALEGAVLASGLAADLIARRRVERFEDF